MFSSSLNRLKNTVKSKVFSGNSTVPGEGPLGFKIGSTVTLSEIDFVALGDETRMSYTREALSVNRSSIVDIGDETHLVRFNCGSEFVFQFTVDNNTSSVTDGRIFYLIDEIFPGDKEEWIFWLGDEDEEAAIGSPTFELPDGTEYFRAILEDLETFIDPVELIEKGRWANKNTFETTWKYMSYARWIDEDQGNAEWLQLICEEGLSGACIKIYVGLSTDVVGFDIF